MPKKYKDRTDLTLSYKFYLTSEKSKVLKWNNEKMSSK